MKYVTLSAVILLTTGCSTTHDLIKDVEGKAYDSLAKAFSGYCGKVPQDEPLKDITKLERVELRREIRQRGTNGPKGPGFVVAGLDEKTAYGPGPVIYVACEGDPVPEDLWHWMVRDWR